MRRKGAFRRGLVAGLPICLGYLSVSFGVGLLAVRSGMTVLQASVMSLTNLTSAGQAAGIEIIGAGGTLIEQAITQFVINLRYALMSLSLSQKLDPSFTVPKRLLASYGITDEIFGVSAASVGKVRPAYMYGMILISAAGWVAGTVAGAAAGSALPASVTGALGIMLYGMFIAIIIPPARRDRKILLVILIAIACSFVFRYRIPAVTSGFAVIFSALIAAVAGALLFPISDEEEDADLAAESAPEVHESPWSGYSVSEEGKVEGPAAEPAAGEEGRS